MVKRSLPFCLPIYLTRMGYRSCRRSLFGLFVLITISGCAAQQTTPANFDAQLISGELAFDEVVPAAPERPLIDLNQDMRQFVSSDIREQFGRQQRFSRLMHKLNDQGFFANPYDPSATYTAAQAFAERRGNCLAYTNMFVALAREAGLDAQYRLVEAQPMWSVTDGYLVRNNHINVVLKSVVPGSLGTNRDVVVDFNRTLPITGLAARTISDGYAQSLYYANLAVDHLRNGDARQAFAHIKRGILLEPNNHDLWVNLGVLYLRLEKFDAALLAYEVALQVRPRSRSAWSGIARVHELRGDLETAQYYVDLSRNYQERNAHYHFALALQSYGTQAYDEALSAVNRAIDLNRKVPEFFALRGLTARQLGDVELAEASFSRQQSLKSAQGVQRMDGLNVSVCFATRMC